jgi:DNA-directed RNA polymerase subunit H (RpoH/RPB5)
MSWPAWLFELKKNQVTMMYDRGFEIPEHEIPLLEKENEYTEEDFLNDFPPDEKLSIFNQIYEKGEDEKILVYYLFINEERKIGTNDMKDFIKSMLETNVNNIILITDRPLAQNPTDTIQQLSQLANQFQSKVKKLKPEEKRALLEKEKLPYFFQHFSHTELVYNPTQHYTTVPHRALSDTEKQDFLTSAKITNANRLPSIKLNDPICKYYGFKLGQLILLDRPNLGNSVVSRNRSISHVVQ